MSAPPFMPLYVGDYLSDTRHLSTEEHGAYLLLLMAMWRAGGRLPNEASKLARICGLTGPKWARLEVEILAFFEVAGDEIGHKRIEKEFKKYTKTCEKRAKAGALGGKAKALKNNDTPLASATNLLEPGYSNQNQNQKEDIGYQPSEIIEPQQNGAAVRRGSRLPEEWDGDKPASAIVFAIEQGLRDSDAFRVLQDFQDYWHAKTGADATKLDWMATWRRWVREDIRRNTQRKYPQAAPKRVGWV